MANETSFPIPPGGKLVCEEGQTGLVRVRTDGSIVASCATPEMAIAMLDASGTYSLALVNWVLALVMGTQRPSWQPLTDEEEQIFDDRTYIDTSTPGGPTRVTFTLPSLKWLRDNEMDLH